MLMTTTEIEYATDLIEDRRLCDREPHVLVQLSRREVTRTYADRPCGAPYPALATPEDAFTEVATPWVVVATWAYHHPTKQGGDQA